MKEEDFGRRAQKINPHEKSKKKPRAAQKRVTVGKEDDSTSTKEVDRVIKTEPLEDGELCESLSTESIRSVSCHVPSHSSYAFCSIFRLRLATVVVWMRSSIPEEMNHLL